jgi:hypothetical protein
MAAQDRLALLDPLEIPDKTAPQETLEEREHPVQLVPREKQAMLAVPDQTDHKANLDLMAKRHQENPAMKVPKDQRDHLVLQELPEDPVVTHPALKVRKDLPEMQEPQEMLDPPVLRVHKVHLEIQEKPDNVPNTALGMVVHSTKTEQSNITNSLLFHYIEEKQKSFILTCKHLLCNFTYDAFFVNISFV